MSYEQATSSTKRLVGLVIAVVFHALLIAGFASGLATEIVHKVQRTVDVAILPAPPPPPPPPPEPEPEPEPEVADEPPPPKRVVKRKVLKPKAYVPPVEVDVKSNAAPNPAAITSVTTAEATPVVRAPRPRKPRRRRIRRARLQPGCRAPRYPKRSEAKGEEGAVSFAFLVGADGRVKNTKMIRSSGFSRLDDAAKKAFEKCRFFPVTVNGVTKPTWVKQSFRWKLQ